MDVRNRRHVNSSPISDRRVRRRNSSQTNILRLDDSDDDEEDKKFIIKDQDETEFVGKNELFINTQTNPYDPNNDKIRSADVHEFQIGMPKLPSPKSPSSFSRRQVLSSRTYNRPSPIQSANSLQEMEESSTSKDNLAIESTNKPIDTEITDKKECLSPIVVSEPSKPEKSTPDKKKDTDSTVQVEKYGDFSDIETIHYKMLRISKFTMTGKRFHFQLYKHEYPLLHSKILSEIPCEIFVSQGISCHISDKEHDAVIRCEKKSNTFFLREKGATKDRALIKFISPPIVGGCRSVSMQIRRESDKKILFLKSIPPKQMPNGEWKQDLGIYENMKYQKSVKNVSLYEEETKDRYLTFIRINDNEATIIAHKDIPITAVHLFGVTSYMTRVF